MPNSTPGEVNSLAPQRAAYMAPGDCLPDDDLEGVDTGPGAVPVQRIVPAAECPPVRQRAAVPSVFALAEAPKLPDLFPRCGGRDHVRDPRPPFRIEREPGIVRLVTMRQDETTEWQEREAARRARQKLPRPPRGAKTRSKKLRALVADIWDE